ncbi:DNA glycosylase AlkZ-like family protein [Dactylosporangium sp. CA-139066]|uniref:DNA glycosylase AlkZ-like family protein n=1 Tax=Dactylosporangium sp. CA-139066 TaxID=3239930 RepID=UPI003D92D122
MTTDELRARRMRAQRLAGPPARSVLDAVERVVGIQAQSWPAARLAVRSRTSGLTAADVDRALAEGELARTWLMRGTLHLVAAADLEWLTALFGPLNRSGGRRRRDELGVSDPVAERALAEIPGILAGAGPMDRAELITRLARRGVRIDPAGQAPAHLVAFAAAAGVLCRGPDLAGGRPSVILAEEIRAARRAGGPRRFEGDAALRELARRYVAGYGPLSPDGPAARSADPSTGPGAQAGGSAGPGGRAGGSAELGAQAGGFAGPGAQAGGSAGPGAQAGGSAGPGAQAGGSAGPGAQRDGSAGPGGQAGGAAGPGGQAGGAAAGPGGRAGGAAAGPGGRAGGAAAGPGGRAGGAAGPGAQAGGSADLAAWSGLPIGTARRALELLGADLSPAADDSLPGGALPPRLLGPFDTVLLGHRDRDFVIPPEHAKRVNAGGGMVAATLLVDGRVAGLWRRAGRKVTLQPFEGPHALPAEVRAALEAEVADLSRFLGQPLTTTWE